MSTSFLTTTFTHAYQSTIPLLAKDGYSSPQMQQVALQTAIDLLHDHGAIIHLNPLVREHHEISAESPNAVKYEEIGEDFDISTTATSGSEAWRQYEIIDELMLPFNYKKDLLFYSAIRGLADGYESFTNPGSNTLIYGKWVVSLVPQSSGGSVINVEETGEVRCNWFLSWYIQWSLTKSHVAMHGRFKEAWDKRMQAHRDQQLLGLSRG